MLNNPLTKGAHRHAVNLLLAATTPQGILTRSVAEGRRRELSAREGIMAGLVGVLSGNEELKNGLRNTLECLSAHEGAQGQIPDRIHFTDTGETSMVSYGQLSGRVEANAWFVVGLGQLLNAENDPKLSARLFPKAKQALDMLDAWEYNGRGLVFIPTGGGWADEYMLSGYVLYDQLMRLWALRCATKAWPGNGFSEKAESLTKLLKQTYWPNPENRKNQDLYHTLAYKNALKRNNGAHHFWLASLGPEGYTHRFDLMANALSLLLGLHQADQLKTLLAFTSRIAESQPGKLLPAFWPPVYPEDPEWRALNNNHRGKFRNKPFQYQNAGLWSFANAWWGLALSEIGENLRAKKMLFSLTRTVEAGKETWGFYEYLHGKKGKVSGASHSCAAAAGWLLLFYSMQDENLLWHNPRPS